MILLLFSCLSAVVLFCPFSLMASQSDSQVRVSIAAIDDLQVSDAMNGIQLQPDGIPGSDTLRGEPDSTARLSYSHNAPGRKKITAQVKPESLPSGTQDITLMVAVSGGTEESIVEGGNVQGAKDVLADIASGHRGDLPVTYSAGATASGTRPGDYRFTVTFTSLDDE